ncbi:putative LRR receptor-like serine/threonine-protein kinase [Senna tora]|uniref:non-specific serine/threonine protein kinase n=1 Tax=Senna tora TaxID=362788 RepID=A0A834WQM6_9FABA|nr:putative LRR receptor-like serine/threonine-protein kinase [Senna tora]
MQLGVSSNLMPYLVLEPEEMFKDGVILHSSSTPSMAFAPMSRPFWCIHLLIFCLTLLWLQFIIPASALGNESDYLALLKFNESISSDPNQMLSSWNTSNHFCNWHGVTCSHKHQRVTELKLEGYGLRGTISPHVGNLSFLRNLSLDSNYFHGEIPAELGRLFRLQNLNLSDNELIGEIPINLTGCTELRYLCLNMNKLSGIIPNEIGSLRKLKELYLYRNNLTGYIPASMWNVSSLEQLSMAYNNLEGSIPEEIEHLKNLIFFSIPVNRFSGALPSSLYNMSSLTRLSLAANHLNGTRLPNNMFSTLSNLQEFYIGGNQISSSIPTSISNSSSLRLFDISENYCVGKVPSLGNLKDLEMLNLAINSLGSSSSSDLDFITSLENCTQLKILGLDHNKFGGSLPNSIANLSTQLIQLFLGGNQFYGTIPTTLGKYTKLVALGLESNQFTGTIPATFGEFYQMQSMTLGENQLNGEIPSSLGNLSELVELYFSENKLEGKIPPIFGKWKYLTFLDLSKNNLSGAIPLQIFSLSSLSQSLNLSHNSLNGSLPIEVENLKNLGTMDISENHLSGEIPKTIGKCITMEYLYLQGNRFSGTMPPSLASMKNLMYLDLSRNNLSGSIPTGLQNISVLKYLNVSFNLLEGEVPIEGVFKNASAISMAGNNKLCGGIFELHLSPCSIKVDTQSKHHNLRLMVILICVAVCLLLSSILAIYWTRKRNKTSSSTSPTIDQLAMVSYQNLHNATEGFSIVNLIGSGSFGSVYKGRIESYDRLVAIKVLNLQRKGAHKSFISECNALKNIRHRNLIKILTCCSSIDYKGQEFKALIFEYMSNGSIDEWLHTVAESLDQPRTLGLDRRLNILYDVASALHYLHCECEQPVVHCDLKPSNILLDDDTVAHVSDFGLARLLSIFNGISQKQSSTTGIKGTIGYAPPEYGTGSEVSTQGDVYSFGILVLEMVTGRRPTEDMFKDGHDLRSYVRTAYPNNILEIVDSTLLRNQIQPTTAVAEEISMEELIPMHPNEEKAIISLLGIGLACSVESPKERLNMMDVTRELNQIKNAFHSHG